MRRRSFLKLAGQAGAGLSAGFPPLQPTAARFWDDRAGRAKGSGSPPLVIPLDREWSIAADPRNAGREEGWFGKRQPAAEPTRVPSIIQETFPGYHGVVWYWLEFEPETHPYTAGRYWLRFEAVDYLADVWLNSSHLGTHEGGETPFALDATSAVLPGQANLLAVRVLNPDDRPIDGFVLRQTAHRNKSVEYMSGTLYDYGGIIEPVELLLTPAICITDLHLRPDWETGRVRIRMMVRNALPKPVKVRIDFIVTPNSIAQDALRDSVEALVPADDSPIEHEISIANHRLWQLDDPSLYRMNASLESAAIEGRHKVAARFGFRDFRVVGGYFRLNGKRLLVRSTHTGNNVPFGQIVSPPGHPDLLRRDLLYAKASGFNTIRFISGVAHPYQLDLCDEIGLMVNEECSASWELEDSPQMQRRYRESVRDMILRDRNHASVVMWGMLNETVEGPVFQAAESALPLVRSLDDTRLVLLSSGRWDGELGVGSVSNPGSSQWEFVWGKEKPGGGPIAKGGPGSGDVHFYPNPPDTPANRRFIRTLGTDPDSKPVFLSEFGVGSMMDVLHEARMYEQAGIRKDAPDYVLIRSMADQFAADWERLGMAAVYPYPETLLHISQLNMARERLVNFNLVRSNPRICGFNLTGMLDHALTGEGVWRFWRDWKPEAFDAMRDGWAPVRWCLFVEPTHAYLGRPVTLEAVLANEDVVRAGQYPARFRLWGPKGTAWERELPISIPVVGKGEDAPLAVPVLKEDVVVEGPPGAYDFLPYIQRGISPPDACSRLYLSDPRSLPRLSRTVTSWRLPPTLAPWLVAHGIASNELTSAHSGRRELILVGDVSQPSATAREWQSLAARLASGSTAIFLAPQAFQRGTDAAAWLPQSNKGRIYKFVDWLYHKECVAKPHPVFAGLQGNGILDWDYYGPMFPRYLCEGQDTPAEVIAVAFAAGYWPGNYHSGVLLGSYRFGFGQFFVNTFPILDNIDRHPVADRLLLNLIEYAAPSSPEPASPLPADFQSLLKQIGYAD